ncbi:transposase [Pasteurella multocida]
MKGLRLNCPECGNALNIRTSSRPSACLTSAVVYCIDCDLKGIINAELTDIKKGHFQPIKETHIWQQDQKIAEQQGVNSKNKGLI